ncbi:tRNA lysidine(34) synthetase [Bartonella raoultii]
MFLVKDYFKTLSVPPEIIVVTVDHRLRRESAREAQIVAEICRAHHIKHIIVRWEGKKPKTHIASKARIARYDLLFQEAQKQGATLIMTGHTLNDQVETYQMRCQRLQKKRYVGLQEIDGALYNKKALETRVHSTELDKTAYGFAQKNDEGICERGLSCIPREALLHKTVRLIRPLLGVERKTLRAYLRFNGKIWIEDPTNEDRRFERVRVRQSLPPKKLMDIAKKVHQAALQRRQHAQKSADLIRALDIRMEYGRCFIAKPADFLQKNPNFSFVVGLFAVLMGGGFYLLSSQKLNKIVQRLSFLSPQKQRFTLAGSVVEYSQSGVAFWRESRNMKKAVVHPGKTCLWDGRYQITNHGFEALKVEAAPLEHLKFCLKNNGFTLKQPHFPSLQSLLMLSNKKGCDIPELTSQDFFCKNVTIKRIIAPFHWLSSREDAPLVHVVEPFFDIKVKR